MRKTIRLDLQSRRVMVFFTAGQSLWRLKNREEKAEEAGFTARP